MSAALSANCLSSHPGSASQNAISESMLSSNGFGSHEKKTTALPPTISTQSLLSLEFKERKRSQSPNGTVASSNSSQSIERKQFSHPSDWDDSAQLSPRAPSEGSTSTRDKSLYVDLVHRDCSSSSKSSLGILKETSPNVQSSSYSHDKGYQLPAKEDFAGSKSEKRCPKRTVSEEKKDDAYWDRRRRNNLAAKKSREMRKAKELEVFQTLQTLEETNQGLKLRVQTLMEKNSAMEEALQSYKKLLEKHGLLSK